MRFVRAKKVGDLSEFGLPAPEEGVFSRLKRLHVAPMIVDAEVLQAIRERRIEIVGAVDGFDETGVLLADGERIEPDTVIAATGYRTGLEPLVGHLGGALMPTASPRVILKRPRRACASSAMTRDPPSCATSASRPRARPRRSRAPSKAVPPTPAVPGRARHALKGVIP